MTSRHITGPCRAWVDRPDRPLGHVASCGVPGHGIILSSALDGTPLADIGRRPVEGGPYCSEHGGSERAESEAVRDWSYVAPAAVGDDEAVQDAGVMALCSPEAILVVRREADERVRERWDVVVPREQAERIRAAWAPVSPTDEAIASTLALTQSYSSADAARARAAAIAERDPERHMPQIVHRPGGVRARPRPWLCGLGVGSLYRHVGAYASREEGVERGLAAWRENLRRVVAEITAARGGTLAWGLPVVPRAEPIIVEPREGEGSWDAYSRTERVVPSTEIDCVRGARADGSGL